VVTGDQAMLEVKNLIWRTKFFCDIRKVGLSVLNERDLVLGNWLVDRQALPDDRATARESCAQDVESERPHQTPHGSFNLSDGA
jgi:hypothetical protein